MNSENGYRGGARGLPFPALLRALLRREPVEDDPPSVLPGKCSAPGCIPR